MNNDISPVALNAAKAIRDVESGGNYGAQGQSGEYGAYQYTEPTWNAAAKKYGINVPLKQATREQQNEVTVRRINDWIKTGKAKNVGQVASMWNAGEGRPNAYIEGHKGVNNLGVSYDTQTYAQRVAQAYQKHKQQSGGEANGYQTQPKFSPTAMQDQTPTETDTLGSRLHGRLQDAAGALTGAAQGQINPLSGLLQTVGAGAGAVNDVAQSALELIPGVKQAEGLIGKGVGKLAQTAPGQAVVKGIGGFTQAHPELSKNIGAVGNIVGALGLASGVGAAKNLAVEGIGRALGKDALTATIDAISPEIKAGTKAGAKIAAKRGLQESAITGTISRVEDPVLRETAQVINEFAPNFAKVKTATKQLDIVDAGISKYAQELRTGLRASEVQPILTAEDLIGLENGLKKEILNNPSLVGNPGLQAERIFNKFKSYLPTNRDILMEDILDARQKLDSYIQSIKPKAFDPATENAFSTALRYVRQGANGLLEEKVPDANVKVLLRKQSLLYDALKNIAVKADREVGTTRFGRFAARHPLTTGLIKKGAKTVGAGITAGLGIEGARKIFGE